MNIVIEIFPWLYECSELVPQFLLMILGLHGLLQYLRCGVNPWIFNLTFCLSKGNTVNRILCSSYIAVFLWLALLFHFSCLHNLGISNERLMTIWIRSLYFSSLSIRANYSSNRFRPWFEKWIPTLKQLQCELL